MTMSFLIVITLLTMSVFLSLRGRNLLKINSIQSEIQQYKQTDKSAATRNGNYLPFSLRHLETSAYFRDLEIQG